MVDKKIGKSIDDWGLWIIEGECVLTRVWAEPSKKGGQDTYDIFYMNSTPLPDWTYYRKVNEGMRANQVGHKMEKILAEKLSGKDPQEYRAAILNAMDKKMNAKDMVKYG